MLFPPRAGDERFAAGKQPPLLHYTTLAHAGAREKWSDDLRTAVREFHFNRASSALRDCMCKVRVCREFIIHCGTCAKRSSRSANSSVGYDTTELWRFLRLDFVFECLIGLQRLGGFLDTCLVIYFVQISLYLKDNFVFLICNWIQSFPKDPIGACAHYD